jgi:uncharacterized membrane protein
MLKTKVYVECRTMQTTEATWPRWTVAALATLGCALTAYITWTKLNAAPIAFCTEGGGCDLVLQSSYASLFGIPLAAFGLGLYALLLLTAVLPGLDRWRWPALFSFSLLGVTFTGYLVYLLIYEIAAFCLFCAGSAILMTSIFVLTLIGHRWEKPDNLVIGGLAVVLLAMGGTYGVFSVQSASAGSLPYSEALAKHLTKSGAKMYGAFWCPHCKQQKELFGAQALRFVPYVECSPNGRGTPQAQVCTDAGVEGYPTWVINGKTYAGEQKLADLARYTGFKLPDEKP